MADEQVKEYLAQLDAVRQKLLEELGDLEREELRYAIDHPRFFTLRRMLLLAATHLQEHTTQLIAAREATGSGQTMPQRILARSQQAYGEFLAAAVGLTDEALDRVPEPGEWSPRQILEHVVQAENWMLEQIRQARAKAEISDKE